MERDRTRVRKLRVYKKAVIIADDLTGANDTTVQFSKQGYRSIVLADIDEIGLSHIFQEYDVVGVNTDSRAQPPNQAYEKVRMTVKEIISAINSSGYLLEEVVLYKKIDSTLRGNITEEIRAIYDELKPDMIVFAPAYPKQKRTTVKGVHLVNGVPVDKTYYGRDIRTPVKHSYIPAYFGEFGKEYKHIDIDELRGMKKTEICNYRVISSDIETEEDMSKLVSIIEECGAAKRIVWVGSAGLAERLMNHIVICSSYKGPVLMCIGSANDTMREQIRELISISGNEFIPLNIEGLINNFSEEYSRVLNKVLESVNAKRISIVLASAFYDEQIRQGEKIASKLGIDKISLGGLISETLGRLCASIVKDVGTDRFSGVFLSGGDTAISTIRRLGSKMFDIVGEIEPGLPLLRVRGSNLKFATKAGGFGDKWTLIRVAYRLND
jgi:uncharacterized protein YgbK (DUF1537 family)